MAEKELLVQLPVEFARLERTLAHSVYELRWSDWFALEGAGRNRALPMGPGLYRIRRASTEGGLDYLGQTGKGVGLRRRLAMLSGVFTAALMPWGDPHTAAPGLWLIRRESSCTFEASVCPLEGDVRVRKSLECLAIALWRQRSGQSPSCNFGRISPGWVKSSNRLDGRRGYFCGVRMPAPMLPVATLCGSPAATGWLGLPWSDWHPLDAPLPDPRQAGLYRFRRGDAAHLVYVGQGLIRQSIKHHAAKTGNPNHRQAVHFGNHQNLQVSWVVGQWALAQRLELVNDAIASHVLAAGIPVGQFLDGLHPEIDD